MLCHCEVQHTVFIQDELSHRAMVACILCFRVLCFSSLCSRFLAGCLFFGCRVGFSLESHNRLDMWCGRWRHVSVPLQMFSILLQRDLWLPMNGLADSGHTLHFSHFLFRSCWLSIHCLLNEILTPMSALLSEPYLPGVKIPTMQCTLRC